MQPTYDLAIIGSAFGGSLLAMIARRLGRSVVLIERGKHPRFAIGESSTPLANLLLEELATRYDLPRLLPLCKWGPWQRSYPNVGCGLKRGFSFFHHEFGQDWQPRLDRANELLVAASPNDEIADTHWYRPDFDQFFAVEAQMLGVDYFDETSLTAFKDEGDAVRLTGSRNQTPVSFRARFVVDASGPRGFLWRTFGLGERPFTTFPVRHSLYAHFRDVGRWSEAGHSTGSPFPPDDAALHHVFPGGWMWVLRFNNGITSAGVSVTEEVACEFKLSDGAAAWERLMQSLPAVARQFQSATPIREFVHTSRLDFRSDAIVGERWALLPSAAGFVDPLFSTGFVLTLLGVQRLARMLEEQGSPTATAVHDYATETNGDLDAAARLLAALHHSFGSSERFQKLTMFYFAAVSFAETMRRLGRPTDTTGFLLRKRLGFGVEMLRLCDAVSRGELSDSADLLSRIEALIEPVNVTGLNVPAKRNWYGCEAADLFSASAKLSASREELEAMLQRAGLSPSCLL
jgi:FADH2 O2-dependent halogenase